MWTELCALRMTNAAPVTQAGAFCYMLGKMQKRPDDERASDPFLKVRHVVILIALVFAFALAVRLTGGAPLPRDERAFFAPYFQR